MQTLQWHSPHSPRHGISSNYLLYTRQKRGSSIFNRPARTMFRLRSKFESAFLSSPSSFSLIGLLPFFLSFSFLLFSSLSLTHAYILPRPSQTYQHGLQIHLGSDQSNQPLLALPPALNEVDSSPSQLFLMSPCNRPYKFVQLYPPYVAFFAHPLFYHVSFARSIGPKEERH